MEAYYQRETYILFTTVHNHMFSIDTAVTELINFKRHKSNVEQTLMKEITSYLKEKESKLTGMLTSTIKELLTNNNAFWDLIRIDAITAVDLQKEDIQRAVELNLETN